MDNDDIPFQELGEKMLRAGWVKQVATSEEGAAFEPTDKGNFQMRKLWEILKELNPEALSADEAHLLIFLAFKEADNRLWE